MGQRTYYQILGVPPTATKDEIRRAYRTAARRFHPDKNAAADADTRFREVAQAYQTLSDAAKRRVYDQALAAPPETPVGQPHYTWTNIASTDASVVMAEEERRERRTEFDQMYDAFFGKREGRRSRKERRDVE